MLASRSLPLFLYAGAVFGQVAGLTLPPSGNNQKASVSQFIGPVQVTIEYASPAVHGPDGKDRRGQIWGKLVPYGVANLGFGNGKPSPWRAGANENTLFSTSYPVAIEGKLLPAGRYGLHMIPTADEWTIIFSKDNGSWGSFFYEESHDALRVQVKPRKHDYREWLTYEFTERRPAEAMAELQWEDLSVPFKIKVENVNEIYISRLKSELNSVPGFDFRSYDAAAQMLLTAKTNLDQALQWADAAINMPGIGQVAFTTLSTKALVLSAMGKDAEAATLMQTAVRLPTTSALEIHQYGRQLLTMKQPAEALKVFQYNAERNGDAWPVHVGLARGYAATGDNKQALDHAKKAVTQAPDELNRKSLEGMVKALSEGQAIQ
jgi:Flp pilus assembly protein TadD